MLTAQIGEDAGIVWRALDGKGYMNLEELQEATNLDSVAICAALGWLAREGKICFTEAEADTIVALA